MAKSKMGDSNLANAYGAAAATDSARLDRLERMMETLATSIAGTNVSTANKSCEECGKSDHRRTSLKRVLRVIRKDTLVGIVLTRRHQAEPNVLAERRIKITEFSNRVIG